MSCLKGNVPFYDLKQYTSSMLCSLQSMTQVPFIVVMELIAACFNGWHYSSIKWLSVDRLLSNKAGQTVPSVEAIHHQRACFN